MYLYKKKKKGGGKITIQDMRKVGKKYQFIKRSFLLKINPQGFDEKKNFLKPEYSSDPKDKNVIYSKFYFWQHSAIFCQVF